MTAWTIREATPEDLPGITRIYNDAVLTTVASFDTTPKTDEEQRAWFAHHGPRHPVLVAADGNEVLGWASLSAWNERGAYADTAEASLYVDEAHRGKGIGRALAEAVIAAGRKAGLHTLVSRIAEGNEVSIRLNEAFGFTPVGVMHEVGWKFGKRLDVYLMEKLLEPDDG
jgi:L-amino acid N-acyltransferase YncA